MHQTFIDFITKATDLILLSRLKGNNNVKTNSEIKPTSKLNDLFQVRIEGNFDLEDKIPPAWLVNNHKLLVIEFFLLPKNNNHQKFLIEQWNFDLNYDWNMNSSFTMFDNFKTDNKIRGTSQKIYKKLMILMRSIITLGGILPLYRLYVSEMSGKFKDLFNIDHNIHFSFRSLSSWHPMITEDPNNIANYTNEEMLIQGVQFAFKVNYVKNLNILFKLVEEEPKPKTILSPTNTDFQRLIKNRHRFLSSDDVTEVNHSEINKDKFSNDSPRIVRYGSYETDKSSLSPVDCIFGLSSLIDTQKPPKIFADYAKRRKSSIETTITSDKLSTDHNKPLDSLEDFGIEIYMVANEDDKFGEFDFSKEIPERNESPVLLNLGNQKELNPSSFPDRSLNDYNQLNLSIANPNKLHKIIQESEDDKIANILHIKEELNKAIWNIRQSRAKNPTISKIYLFDDNNNHNKISKHIRVELKRANLDKNSKNNEFLSLYSDLKAFAVSLEE